MRQDEVDGDFEYSRQRVTVRAGSRPPSAPSPPGQSPPLSGSFTVMPNIVAQRQHDGHRARLPFRYRAVGDVQFARQLQVGQILRLAA